SRPPSRVSMLRSVNALHLAGRRRDQNKCALPTVGSLYIGRATPIPHEYLDMATTGVGVVLRHIRKLAAADGTGKLSDHQLLERFASRHDDVAFATLVERHGAMVLGVCRRVLHHLHDAEDAFQATFLILARKAGSIRRHDSIA